MMKTENITSAMKKDDNSIQLTLTDPFDGETTCKHYAAIRGGISWPTAKAPAYFCIVGQECTVQKWVSDKPLIGTRILLAEYESESFALTSQFYNRITDIAEQMMCHDFYVTMPENRYNCGYLHDFDDFTRERNSKVHLQSAYDADNFLLGLSRIKGGLDAGGLIIPDDSIAFAQLQGLTRPDLENSPEEIFFSINALRHIIGSYHRNPPRNIRLSSRLRRPSNWRAC